jgi:hypothetical protein
MRKGWRPHYIELNREMGDEERELSPDEALPWKSREILDGIQLRLRITA